MAWLHSPPDQFGFVDYRLFREIFMTFLGMPSTVMILYLGKIFGIKGGQHLDEHGTNSTLELLPGKGLHLLHNTIEHTIQAMMRLCGIQFNQQVVKYLVENSSRNT